MELFFDYQGIVKSELKNNVFDLNHGGINLYHPYQMVTL